MLMGLFKFHAVFTIDPTILFKSSTFMNSGMNEMIFSFL